ncbi:MAG TPA: hypothetical protein VKA59_11640 [Vicinamibacterales bacterium]|nr:hypothetical protein [Vicinamibacterales bacterium]
MRLSMDVHDTAGAPHQVNATVELKQAEPEKGIDWPAWIGAISPILLAIVGLYFTDTVRVGFERQQLQLANASGMQALLVQLLGDKVSQTEARAAASTLAAFGPPAVAPLVTALADADDVRTPAIEGALRAIGLNEPTAVCGPLLSILEHQTGRYSWLMHRSAIRVIADVRCPQARALLQTYKQALAASTLKAFDPATEEWKPLPPEIVDLLKADVDRALLEPK